MQANELKAVLDAGKRVRLVDVRTPAEFGEIHIAGAELMPMDRMDATKIQSAGANADACVLICRSGKRAALARQNLQAAGCTDLEVLEGGVDAWAAIGLPVVRGAEVMSLERQVRITAGFMVVAGVVLGIWVHPALLGLSAFVGAGLMFAGITDWCGMAMLLARMPWNQKTGITCTGNSCSTQ
jgi:rhodanese-related sulfurtransferase